MGHLTVQLIVRALIELEINNPQKTSAVKDCINLMGLALEEMFKCGACPPNIPQKFRLLRRAEIERKTKMFKKNFTASTEEFKDKNIKFFEALESTGKIVYDRKSDNRDIYFDLLWVNKNSVDENCIPAPVFLDIIGANVSVTRRSQILDLLKEKEIEVEYLENDFFSDEELDDDEKMRKFVMKSPSCIYLTSEDSSLRDDKELILSFFKDPSQEMISGPQILQYLSDRLKDDKDVVKLAVQVKGESLEYASERLKNDKEIVTIAVSDYGWNLQYASEHLRDNEEILYVALKAKMGEHALEYSSPRIRAKKSLVLEVVCKFNVGHIYASDWFSAELKTSEVFSECLSHITRDERKVMNMILPEWKNIPYVKKAITEACKRVPGLYEANDKFGLGVHSEPTLYVFKTGKVIVGPGMQANYGLFFDNEGKLVPPALVDDLGEPTEVIKKWENIPTFYKLLVVEDMVLSNKFPEVEERSDLFELRSGQSHPRVRHQVTVKKIDQKVMVVREWNHSWHSANRKLYLNPNDMDFIRQNAEKIYDMYWEKQGEKVNHFEALYFL
ncbi:MAG: DUF4116 domain-containing protein [Candidatus Komeilibacteria bacterium]|nr:DUF4116 domain-containing protein [Candidatus Komeilibacteria bacterium]